MTGSMHTVLVLISGGRLRTVTTTGHPLQPVCRQESNPSRATPNTMSAELDDEALAGHDQRRH